MGRATWLADVLRAEGLHVVELDGWKTRETRTSFEPQGIVLHHTATPKSASDLTVRRILREGRSDLAGPLCQLGLERDGTFVCVAAGRANHAGYGSPWGNDSFGIEAYNDGQGEPWPSVQVDAWVRGCAAICIYLGWDPAIRVKGHREVDPTRKIDPLNIDLADFRRDVTTAITSGDDDLMGAADDILAKLSNLEEVLRVRGITGSADLDDVEAGKRSVVERRVSATYRDVAALKAQIAALVEAVGQLGAGGSVDYAKVEAAAEKAVKDVLGSIDN